MSTAIRQSINKSVLWTFPDVPPAKPRDLPRNVVRHGSGYRFAIQINGIKHNSITYSTVERAVERLEEFKSKVGIWVEITYRIPSKKVPYGYIEITGTEAELYVQGLDPEEMARSYAQYILDYQSAEVQAFENPSTRQAAKASKVDESVADAVKILSEGLGATEIDENEPAAPWTKTSDETVTQEEKPWEADEADWDFG